MGVIGLETAKGSGLGKGLAGILGQALATERAPEVSRLLGIRESPETRKLVTELALNTLAEAYQAEGVIVVDAGDIAAATSGDISVDAEPGSAAPPATGRGDAQSGGDAVGLAKAVASRLPVGWHALDAEGFEVAGRLWSVLHTPEFADAVYPLGQHNLLIVRHDADRGPLAAAMVRRRAFDDQERLTIARLIRSVAHAVGREEEHASALRLVAKVETTPSGAISAKLRRGRGFEMRHGSAVAPDTPNAMAAAAAQMVRSDLAVVFAGEAPVREQRVAVVIIDDGLGPLFGMAVSDPGDATSPARAVLHAAASL